MIDNLTTSLKGKNALICGSTAGIGKAVSKEFAQMGANVTLFSRNEDKLKLVIESMDCINNQNHRFLVGDFNHPDNIQSVINNDISQGNTYHILINNGIHESPMFCTFWHLGNASARRLSMLFWHGFPRFPAFAEFPTPKNLLQVAFFNLFHGPKVQKQQVLKFFCNFHGRGTRKAWFRIK